MNNINCFNKFNFIASDYNILIIEDSTSMSIFKKMDLIHF